MQSAADTAGATASRAAAEAAIETKHAAEGAIRFVEVSITNAEMLALKATPKTLVAAPGAGKVLQLLDGLIFFDYTAAYTEISSTYDMRVRYADGSGSFASLAIDATTLLLATADTLVDINRALGVAIAKASCENLPLVLCNIGANEYGGGDAANVVRVKLTYRVWPTGW